MIALSISVIREVKVSLIQIERNKITEVVMDEQINPSTIPIPTHDNIPYSFICVTHDCNPWL